MILVLRNLRSFVEQRKWPVQARTNLRLGPNMAKGRLTLMDLMHRIGRLGWPLVTSWRYCVLHRGWRPSDQPSFDSREVAPDVTEWWQWCSVLSDVTEDGESESIHVLVGYAESMTWVIVHRWGGTSVYSYDRDEVRPKL